MRKSKKTLSAAEKAAEDASEKEELKAVGAPPQNDPAALKRQRESMLRRVDRYLKRFKIRTVEELMKDQGLDLQTPDKPLRELIPLLKRFDWRRYQVVPYVRDQGADCQICWAEVATEAFESALMIKQAKFATLGSDRLVLEVERISLSVKTTLDCVPPRNCEKGGRHEKAFKHYFEFGVPVKGINLFPPSNQLDPDFKLAVGNCTRKEKTGIKAIGWDYVHLPPHEIPTVQEMKEALLEHGPVVAFVCNDKFEDYRHPDNDDDAIHTEKGFVEYPEDTAPVFETDTENVINHYVLIIGWDDDKRAWIIQNTFGTKWGYQCDGPRVMSGAFRSEDRGFMYIRWGSNQIGKFASWIEAPLLSQGWRKKIEKQSHSRFDAPG